MYVIYIYIVFGTLLFKRDSVILPYGIVGTELHFTPYYTTKADIAYKLQKLFEMGTES